MVELPELETLRRELEKEVLGKRFKAPEVLAPEALARSGGTDAFVERVEGAKVKAVERRGRVLAAVLDSADLLGILLSDGARLEKVPPRGAAPAGTMVTFTFTQGGPIRLVDPKGASEVFVVAPAELPAVAPESAPRALDPVAGAVSWTSFARLLRARPAKLKAFLTDPEALAVIGPLYSDEILWEAGLRHDRSSDSLSPQDIRRLYRALVETLHEAVKHRGTTVEGHQFLDLYGKPGGYQAELKVYGRDGEPCKRCRAPIQKARLQNRPLYFCAQCQV